MLFMFLGIIMKYLIVSYKSRNSLYAFAKILRQYGIASSIINTPRNIALSCGLSLKVDFAFYGQVSGLINVAHLPGFWGVFMLTKAQTHDQIERLI